MLSFYKYKMGMYWGPDTLRPPAPFPTPPDLQHIFILLNDRYEEKLREEDRLAQSAFDKRQESRKNRRGMEVASSSTTLSPKSNVPSSSSALNHQPTPEESYDFFTKAWDSNENEGGAASGHGLGDSQR